MGPASISSAVDRDARVAEISIGDRRARVTAPLDGVLRVRIRRAASVRPNYVLAVQSALTSGELESDGNRLSCGSLTLLQHDDASIEFQSAPAALREEPERRHAERLFTLGGVAAPDEATLTADVRVAQGDPFFGVGELSGPMNRRHRRCINWNLDYWPHTPSTASFYASFPFYLSRARDSRDGSLWYGVFVDHTGRSTFSFAIEPPQDGLDRVELSVHKGDLDLYVLAGPTPAEVVRRYAALTGTMEMPPRWMFGFQQSRWSYEPAERVEELARTFRETRFPCDVIYLDIDYLDRFRAFTWNKEKFPDPKGLIDRLHASGFKVIPILNSAVAVDAAFDVYREGHERGYFLKRPDGSEYHARMWPGLSAFPDFSREDVREWWGGLHADLLDLGVDGLWNDMNEPTIFADDPPQTFPMDLVHQDGRPHEELHNAYGMLMDMATHQGVRKLRPERRIPLLTRSAYAGVQRYAMLWTGDNSAWWEHMRMCIAQVCNLGLCGVSVSGPDVGGFLDDPSGEMFLRWLQMGIFFPYLRAHSAKHTRDAEPWVFGDEILELARRAADMRYALLPYIYTLAAQSSRYGDPMMRPLFYEFPQDPSCEAADDQFMLGPDILVAPILSPGRFYRAVYLPPGEWYSYFGETLHEGAAVTVAETPLTHIPVYVRANAIVPMAAPMQHEGEKARDVIYWHVWPSSHGSGAGWLYEDDGVSAPAARAGQGFCETRVHASFRDGEAVLQFEARHGDHSPAPRRFEMVVHGHGRARTVAQFEDDGSAREIRLSTRD